MKEKREKRIRLKKKIRAKIQGTNKRPRLSVFRSNRFIYAQIIDDAQGKTLLSASDRLIKKGNKTERAKKVGELIGAACQSAKIKQVVFDRGGFKYTGRIKQVAEAARASGLNF